MVMVMEDDSTQLTLIEAPEREWRLDERTRSVGRQGVEDARRALQEAARKTAA
jgi:hypothetical protein